LDAEGKIDQIKMDHVARLGGDWYSRVIPESLFKVAKPLRTKGIGVDALPEYILNSKILTGNNLGQLGNVEELPAMDESEQKQIEGIKKGLSQEEIHLKAKQLLDDGDVNTAWKLLLNI